MLGILKHLNLFILKKLKLALNKNYMIIYFIFTHSLVNKLLL
jgi:hypothetical protein